MSRYLDYNEPIIPGGSFTWGEYLLLRDWKQLVVPSDAQLKNIIFLFKEIQKLRVELGKPLIITSGIRSLAYTKYLRSIGTPAAVGSAHIDGSAVDIWCPGMTTKALWEFCRKRWPGRMESLAYTKTWVHLDTRQWGKRITFNP